MSIHAHRRAVIELSPAAREAVHRATIALLRHRGSDRDPIATAGEALDAIAADYVEMVEAEIADTLSTLTEPTVSAVDPLVEFARLVRNHTKHGREGRGLPGDCERWCLKCRAEAILAGEATP